MSPRRRSDNEARPVRCSANCGTLTWLKGALPVAADTEHLCSSCRATWRCQAGHDWTGDRAGAAAHETAHHEGAQTCWPIDEEVEAYRRSRCAGDGGGAAIRRSEATT